jgi:hypothetical protein
MYQYFQDKVTRAKKECESTVAAARKGMEKKPLRKSLPNEFKFNPRMVSQFYYVIITLPVAQQACRACQT